MNHLLKICKQVSKMNLVMPLFAFGILSYSKEKFLPKVFNGKDKA